jgi:hypothetical protein
LFKKGDWIRGNLESRDMYGITNDSMYLGYVYEVTDHGGIKVLVAVHKNLDVCGTSWIVSNSDLYFSLASDNFQVATEDELEHFLLETEG